MALFTQSSFNAPGIRSLCWRGDQLVDWVGGARAFGPDGTEQPQRVIYGYRFDAATASPDGRFAVIYERLCPKGLLLDDGRIVRELDRSFYHADVYEYPVALFNDPDGRTLLAHCPGDYCELNWRKRRADDRSPHQRTASRRTSSIHGCWPALMEGEQSWRDGPRRTSSPSARGGRLRRGQSGLPSLIPAGRIAWNNSGDRTTLRPFAYRHPKLIDLSTGKVIHVWTELRSGVQDGSIVGHLEGAANPPPMAFDPATGRFAVANGDAVTLIRFSPSAAGAR